MKQRLEKDQDQMNKNKSHQSRSRKKIFRITCVYFYEYNKDDNLLEEHSRSKL